jgi:uncharacterized damage-inducible protein DinB
MKAYRQGGLGAMMDEYERAAGELLDLLASIDAARFEHVDASAPEHARSFQEIMEHVVYSGYSYANYLRAVWGIPVTSPEVKPPSRDGAIASLRNVLAYTAETLEGKWTLPEEETDQTTFVVGWNVRYSVEQMMEHAIVHVMRHRRQIAKIIGK